MTSFSFKQGILNLFQTGKISQAQFLKSIAKLQTPEQVIEKKQHKIAKTKTTKIINKAVKNYSASKKITNDIIAQGNTLMGYDGIRYSKHEKIGYSF